MKTMLVRIKDMEKSGFSACCIYELARESVKEGDIIEGVFHPENKAIDFVSKNGIDCVAWLGITCEEVRKKDALLKV